MFMSSFMGMTALKPWCSEHLEAFECKKCEYKTNFQLELRIHNKSHEIKQTSFNIKVQCCSYCNFQTVSTIVWRNHISSCKRKRYKCKDCEYRTDSKHNYTQHTTRQHNASFACAHCKYVARRKDTLKSHLETRHNFTLSKQEIMLACPYCDFVTKRKFNLKRHLSCKHEDCLDEDHPISSNLSMNDLQLDCSNIDWKYCSLCDFRTKTRYQLRNHQNRLHYNARVAQCPHCPHQSKHRNDLTKHIMSKHTAPEKIKWFHCEYCSYKGKRGSHLRSHRENCHKWYICGTCNVQTQSSDMLMQHIQRWHS